MNRYVSDTHALFWYLTNSPRLGPNASLAFDAADQGQAESHIPAIVLAELYYLNEKFGRNLDFVATFHHLATRRQFVLVAMLLDDILQVRGKSGHGGDARSFDRGRRAAVAGACPHSRRHDRGQPGRRDALVGCAGCE